MQQVYKMAGHRKYCGSCGAMDNASDYESEDCRFESCQDRFYMWQLNNQTNRKLPDNRPCVSMGNASDYAQKNAGSRPERIVRTLFGNMGAKKNDSKKSLVSSSDIYPLRNC
jgi:hypothetical protein